MSKEPTVKESMIQGQRERAEVIFNALKEINYISWQAKEDVAIQMIMADLDLDCVSISWHLSNALYEAGYISRDVVEAEIAECLESALEELEQ